MTGKKQTAEVTPRDDSAEGEPGGASADLVSVSNRDALHLLLEAAARQRAEVADALADGKRKRQRRVKSPH